MCCIYGLNTANNRLAWITKQEIDLFQNEILNTKVKYEAGSSLYANKVIAKLTFLTTKVSTLQKSSKL